jgi:hypothetical protein
MKGTCGTQYQQGGPHTDPVVCPTFACTAVEVYVTTQLQLQRHEPPPRNRHPNAMRANEDTPPLLLRSSTRRIHLLATYYHDNGLPLVFRAGHQRYRAGSGRDAAERLAYDHGARCGNDLSARGCASPGQHLVRSVLLLLTWCVAYCC